MSLFYYIFLGSVDNQLYALNMEQRLVKHESKFIDFGRNLSDFSTNNQESVLNDESKFLLRDSFYTHGENRSCENNVSRSIIDETTRSDESQLGFEVI